MIEYDVNDIVTVDGSTYCCILAHDTSNPTITKPGEGSAWQTYLELWAAKGEQGEPGSVTFEARTTVAATTASLADGAIEDTTVKMEAGYRLLKVETDVVARVRVYDSTAHRTSDAARAVGVDPTGVHGVILDLVTTVSDLSWWLSPVVDGYTADAGDTVPIAVTNISGSTDTVTVTFTWVRSE